MQLLDVFGELWAWQRGCRISNFAWCQRGRHRSTIDVLLRSLRGRNSIRMSVGRNPAFVLVATKPAKVFEIAVWHRGDVFAGKDADLELAKLAVCLCGINACCRQVIQVLEDDSVGIDMLSKFLGRFAICNKFCRRSMEVVEF